MNLNPNRILQYLSKVAGAAPSTPRPPRPARPPALTGQREPGVKAPPGPGMTDNPRPPGPGMRDPSIPAPPGPGMRDPSIPAPPGPGMAEPPSTPTARASSGSAPQAGNKSARDSVRMGNTGSNTQNNTAQPQLSRRMFDAVRNSSGKGGGIPKGLMKGGTKIERGMMPGGKLIPRNLMGSGAPSKAQRAFSSAIRQSLLSQGNNVDERVRGGASSQQSGSMAQRLFGSQP